MTTEEYIGDGLYVSRVDVDLFKLRAPRGDEDHEVFLDREMIAKLNKFVEKSHG